MKKNALFLAVFICIALIMLSRPIVADPVDRPTALSIACARLLSNSESASFSVKTIELIHGSAGSPLFYYVHLNPDGFMIIPANDDLPPVIAYGFSETNSHKEEFIRFVTNDLEQRTRCIGSLPSTIIGKRHKSWENYLSSKPGQPGFQQWPEPGSTSTGGWLETNWTQDYPYNTLCPLDPLNGNRSIAGCPAVAMSMIVNFHQTTNQVVFTDADDYHHQYAGRNYWIDDDYQTIDFPSFPMLNVYLDTLMAHYLTSQPLTKNDKGAIVFACGVAARQVYTSSGSGTFGVDQAFDAYQKFNFSAASLLTDSDTSLYTHIAQNIMDTLPVHLAVVDQGWTMGHNVVVDGYNTDNYFHLNFGWGGGYNGWYLLPDEIPYGLTVIEGVIVDIIPDFPTDYLTQGPDNFSIYPNPTRGQAMLSTALKQVATLTVYSLSGIQVLQTTLPEGSSTFDFSALTPGVYLVTVSNQGTTIRSKLIRL
ncbi:MAG: thiol protease/hemagglutinin PrtT [Bacteroidales bacterium]|nr:thiol protease/hemagglutinin PrtT [Bacteroidales bacterium]